MNCIRANTNDAARPFATPLLMLKTIIGSIDSKVIDPRKAVSEALEKCLKGRHTDWNKIKLVIRDAMNDYIWKKTKRRPMVIPIIMDVDV